VSSLTSARGGEHPWPTSVRLQGAKSARDATFLVAFGRAFVRARVRRRVGMTRLDGRDDDDEASAPPARLAPGVAPGTIIVLRNIVSQPELNGRQGWSLGLDPKTKRVQVQLNHPADI